MTKLDKSLIHDVATEAAVGIGNDVAKSLMSMSRMAWAKEITGDEALRRAAQAYRRAAEKV